MNSVREHVSVVKRSDFRFELLVFLAHLVFYFTRRICGVDGGAIVNFSQAAAKHSGPGSYIDYAASKAAVDTFAVELAKEQASEGIQVNCIRPGAILTEISRNWMETHPEWLDRVISRTPLGHPGEEADITNATL